MVLQGWQMLLTIGVIAAGTILTRFLPVIIFPAGREAPAFIKRLQTLLPCAVIGLLVVYCLKDVSLFTGSHGIPEAISILLIAVLHVWKKNTFISIGAGTLSYIFLVQYVFTA